MNKVKSGLVTAFIVTGAAACAASTQQASSTVAHGADCAELYGLEQQVAQVYDVTRVRHAGPLYTQRLSASGEDSDELIGAELYVNAEAGVSQPYLERVLSCHAASMAADHPHDPLRTRDIRELDVRVQGHQFVIAIKGADLATGREIWRKAQALVQPHERVELEQLSADETAPTS